MAIWVLAVRAWDHQIVSAVVLLLLIVVNTPCVMVKQLLDVGLGRVLSTTYRSFNIRQFVLLAVHLLKLHLLNVLAYLLCKQVAELVSDLVSLSKLQGKLVRVVSLADQDVLIAPLSDFNGQRQDLLTARRRALQKVVSSGRGPRRRTFVVARIDYLLLLLHHVHKVVVLQIIQITRQSKRFKKLLLHMQNDVNGVRKSSYLELVVVRLIKSVPLVPVLVGEEGAVWAHFRPLFVTFASSAEMRLVVGLAKGKLLPGEGCLVRVQTTSSVLSTLDTLRDVRGFLCARLQVDADCLIIDSTHLLISRRGVVGAF